MKTLLLFYISMIVISMGCTPGKTESKEDIELTEAELIKRGEYLTTVGGCNDCHTPKLFSEKGMEMDVSRLLSGHPENTPLPEVDPRALAPGYWVLLNDQLTAAVGPWGMSFAQNLTPHETGIKNWTLEAFTKALKTGKHMGTEKGRPIMPPMPWFNLMNLEEQDYRAIFTYLHSLPPINNHVPAPKSPEEVMALTKK
ncbi:MAG: diheme cytochrome c-553 [Cyclobacteriaceae bacterium]|nr:diheme cytochrome c-553 [Cyclobacteriaceae bacterium]